VTRPERVGELWTYVGVDRCAPIVAIVVRSFEAYVSMLGHVVSYWTHRFVDLSDGSSFEAVEHIVSDPSSAWRRIA